MSGEVLLILTIAIALAFDVINGFHDAANSIATIVSTRVLKPKHAVLWAAFFNFIAFIIFAPRVAETISRIVKITPLDPNYSVVIFSGIFGACLWDLITWWLGLPTSSSHALIGGFAGAGIAYGGLSSVDWDTIVVIIAFIVISPVLGFILGSFFLSLLYRLMRKQRPLKVDRWFRLGQLLSASLYSLGHGANDAQKTMGMILALLIAQGLVPEKTTLSLSNPKTLWVILSCQAAIGIGTALGGWRIIKTMGMRLTKLKPIGGFSAESGGALTLFLATHFGIPVSTTHTITGAIIGVGSLTSKVSAVKWGVARKIFIAWILTLPFAGLISGGLVTLWIL